MLIPQYSFDPGKVKLSESELEQELRDHVVVMYIYRPNLRIHVRNIYDLLRSPDSEIKLMVFCLQESFQLDYLE